MANILHAFELPMSICYRAGCGATQVKPEELRSQLEAMESKNSKFYNVLSKREKEIVCFMDVVHPLPSAGEKFEEVMDVSGPQTFVRACVRAGPNV